jgi:hypothetical protein
VVSQVRIGHGFGGFVEIMDPFSFFAKNDGMTTCGRSTNNTLHQIVQYERLPGHKRLCGGPFEPDIRIQLSGELQAFHCVHTHPHGWCMLRHFTKRRHHAARRALSEDFAREAVIACASGHVSPVAAKNGGAEEVPHFDGRDSEPRGCAGGAAP